MSLKLLSVEEVLNLLKKSNDTAYYASETGRFPGRNVEFDWCFPKDEVELFVLKLSENSLFIKQFYRE